MNALFVRDKFYELFNAKSMLVRSPGRVNLIGEHTDYNQGFVLPAAIDKEIIFAIAPTNNKKCQIVAFDLNDTIEFELAVFSKSDKTWANYLLGVIAQLQKLSYPLRAFNCVFAGDIPVGAGLSSSAALETGFAFALNELFGLNIAKQRLAKIAQKAEHEYVGTQCGIMDQFINLFGLKAQVVKLDCRSLEFQYYPFIFKEVLLVLCDSQISHSLASSEYNLRRQQCQSGVEFLSSYEETIQSLRDVSIEMLQAHEHEMEPIIHKRCLYVIQENSRVVAACEDLENGDLQSLGQKMYKTHVGLRDDYEVSCPQLDFLVEIAQKQEGVFGARMMGGGFGGCTINLIHKDVFEAFSDRVKTSYNSKFSNELKIHKIQLESGTSVIV